MSIIWLEDFYNWYKIAHYLTALVTSRGEIHMLLFTEK